MNHSRKFWLGIVLLPSLCMLAVGQGKGHGHGHNKHDDEGGYAYTKHDRDVAWRWYQQHENGLPPGLAKKDRLPPGLEKQLAVRGTLPPGLQKKMRPCPPGLVHELPPPPPNCEHTMIGGHIVLVNRTTHVVVDIIHFE
jgi:hypothetical protein